MTRWKYLQVHVYWRDTGDVDHVSTNGKLIFNYDSENKDKKRGDEKNFFNFADYIDVLGKDGWELVNVFFRGHGWGEAYIFKQIIQE